MPSVWDITALINAANPRASLAERHLWLVRLMEWLRHAPRLPAGELPREGTALPLLRLKHLLNVLDQQPALKEQVAGSLQAFWREIDIAALLADFGFGSRLSLRSEVAIRLRQALLPGTPETRDLAELFPLIFDDDDLDWVEQIDATLLERIASLAVPDQWQSAALHAITLLASGVRAAGFAPLLRQRMDAALVRDEPFRQLAGAVERFQLAQTEGRHADTLVAANMLRGLLDQCLAAAASVHDHLEAHGVSVDVVYELDQMQGRARRIDQLLALVLSPQALPEVQALLLELLRVQRERRGFRTLLSHHYSLLARQVAERSAETGEHYITRDRAEYRTMLRRALGGGAVIAGTTYLKFGLAAIGLSAFWGGFFAGVNYAASFLVVMLLHATVATKQPAMTAPAMAASLPLSGRMDEAALEGFVDRVVQLIRSQAAAVAGNLLACVPLVAAVQLGAWLVLGRPLLSEPQARYVLDSITLLGPTAFFAAFTGVVLFVSSLIAGWAENWFVFHRLDSAIAWNPRIVARLGAPRAMRWAAWWRANVSGVAANTSLGMMLGLLPALAGFVGLPIDVRHVTLASGQLAAAAGTLGFGVLATAAFWWCVAGVLVTGVLNVAVSFGCAFKVALRSRGVRLTERARIRSAIWARWRAQPLSFLRPPRDAA